MPTTTNFGWTTPADTDLVKDGAAAIRTLGNGIDTSFLDLKGGTTGQVLSKNSNTDLDYTWITPNVGDITEVQAGTGISISSGTGPIPVVTNTVATAFDAAGDLVYGTGADTFTKLSLGTAGQVLTVNSGATAPQWSTPAAGGKVLQVVQATYSTAKTITSATYTDTDLSVSITPSSASSKVLILVNQITFSERNDAETGASVRLLRDSTSILDNMGARGNLFFRSYDAATGNRSIAGQVCLTYLDSPATTSALTYKTQARVKNAANDSSVVLQESSTTSVIIAMEIGA